MDYTLIRRQKWTRDKWLPKFVEEYKLKSDNFKKELDNRINKSLCYYIREKILFPVDNIPLEDMRNIPGIFRIRFHLTESNMVLPILEIPEESAQAQTITQINISDVINYQTGGDNSYYHGEYDPFDIIDNDIANNMAYILEKSKLQYEKELDDELEKAINESKSYADNELEKALVLSQMDVYNFPNTKIVNNADDKFDDTNNIIFNVCLDIRLYGPNPTTPILIDDMVFYLNEEQIKKIQDVWKKIDPETPTGINTLQNIQYFKGIAKDLNPNKNV